MLPCSSFAARRHIFAVVRRQACIQGTQRTIAARAADDGDAWGNWGGDPATLGKALAGGASARDTRPAGRGRGAGRSTSGRSDAFDGFRGRGRGGGRGRSDSQRDRSPSSWRGESGDSRRTWGSDGSYRNGAARGATTFQRGRRADLGGEGAEDEDGGGRGDVGRGRARGRFVDKYGAYREDWEAQVRSQDEIATARQELQGADLLYGVAPLFAALTARRRTMHTLFVQDSMDLSKRKDAGQVGRIKELAEAAGVAVRYTSKHVLNDFADQRPHQGLVLDCEELEWEALDVLPTAAEAAEAAAARGAGTPIWLAMDQVMDPQNLGAMVRSAYFLGAAGVLGSQKNCAPLSAVASKASAGALEVWQLYDASNLARTLEQAAQDGWQVLGADGGSSAVSISEVAAAGPTLVVLGNEGYGLRTNVKRACSQWVRIEASKRSDAVIVDSLNVSVATGILLHHLASPAPQLASAV